MFTLRYALVMLFVLATTYAEDCSDSHAWCNIFTSRYAHGTDIWRRKCNEYPWARQCKICTMFCDDSSSTTTTTTRTTKRPTTTTKRPTTSTTTPSPTTNDCKDTHGNCWYFTRYFGKDSSYCHYYNWAKQCKESCSMFCETGPVTTTTTKRPTTTTTRSTTTKKPTTTTKQPTITKTTTTKRSTTSTTRSTTTTKQPATTTTKQPTTTRRTTTITIQPGAACGDKQYWCAIVAKKDTATNCARIGSQCLRTCICTGPANEKCSNLMDEPGYDCNQLNCLDSDDLDRFRARRFCGRTCCSKNQLYV